MPQLLSVVIDGSSSTTCLLCTADGNTVKTNRFETPNLSSLIQTYSKVRVTNSIRRLFTGELASLPSQTRGVRGSGRDRVYLGVDTPTTGSPVNDDVIRNINSYVEAVRTLSDPRFSIAIHLLPSRLPSLPNESTIPTIIPTEEEDSDDGDEEEDSDDGDEEEDSDDGDGDEEEDSEGSDSDPF
jgi:hypothetical protein